MAVAVPTYRNTYLPRQFAKTGKILRFTGKTRWATPRIFQPTVQQAANLIGAPAKARYAPSQWAAYRRLALQLLRATNPEVEWLARAGPVLALSSYTLGHIHGWAMAPATGAWGMPAADGWTKSAECVAGGGGSTATHVHHQLTATSGVQNTQTNSCIGNQAEPANTNPLPFSGIPSNMKGVYFLQHTHDTVGGDPRYALRVNYSRPGTGNSQPVQAPRPMQFPRNTPGPLYTKVPNVELEAKPSGELTIEIGPQGGLRVRPGSKRMRTKGESKPNPWQRKVMKYISRGVESVSEFIEFSNNAAEALGYEGPKHGRDAFRKKVIWLYWEGNIDRLDMETIDTMVRNNDVEDKLYGKWQQSFDKATKPAFGPRSVEVGQALDGWQL